mmetsp:Transcript_1743/g.3121  ORF Transcript_1743/g.3121 Transcript_1743/m.3121 type:complete len:543 (+) Transcript_1743:184-1812(+)
MLNALVLLLMSSLANHVTAGSRQPSEAHLEAGNPYMMPLRRESVPIKRHGKIASFKTTYSGLISVGSPARQEFRAVFDTGSGHVVLPSADCGSESCLAHRRYDMTLSHTAQLINADGTLVEEGEYADQATIGFGTGQITGEFVQDNLCLGPGIRPEAVNESDWLLRPCTDVAIVSAIEMSTQPFKSFKFDGIIGLGLSSLAVSPAFSFFAILASKPGFSPRFGFFLTEDDDKEESELALGGYNPSRLLEPLAWTAVAKADLGHWQVPIIAVRIDGKVLDLCVDGTCRGIVDTGSSHLGVPKTHHKEVAEKLTKEAVDILDCRLALAPTVEIELPGVNITVPPMTYMRRLPLREGVSVSSGKGVTMHPDLVSQARAPPTEGDQMSVLNVNMTTGAGLEVNKTNVTSNSSRSQASELVATPPPLRSTKRFCRPKTMPVDLPAPLGPKLFILGEPVLHRYYTVYDWSVPRIGWGLAANRQNMADPGEEVDRVGSLPDGVDSVLLQKHVQMDLIQAGSLAETDDFALAQVTVQIRRAARVCLTSTY